MIAVGVCAVVLAVSAQIWLDARRYRYRQAAHAFAASEQASKQELQSLIQAEQRHLATAKRTALEAMEQMKRVRTMDKVLRNRREYFIRTPGSGPEMADDLALSSLTQGMRQDLSRLVRDALEEDREASQARADAAAAARKSTHFSKLSTKYERASRYPWLPVAPDPPAPE